MIWLIKAREAINTIALEGAPFTTDDVWALLDEWGEGRADGRSALGPVMTATVNAGVISRMTRTVPTISARAHGRRIPVYLPGRVADNAAAGWVAYDEIATVCPLPECRRPATSWRGNVQHMKQVHGLGTVTPTE